MIALPDRLTPLVALLRSQLPAPSRGASQLSFVFCGQKSRLKLSWQAGDDGSVVCEGVIASRAQAGGEIVDCGARCS